MHELSVALGILKIAEQEAAKAHAIEIKSIELEIGTLAGIELDALEFIWPSATKETILEHSKMEIKTIEGEAICIDCDTVFKVEHFYDHCPNCDSSFKSILKGKELRVKSLEVE